MKPRGRHREGLQARNLLASAVVSALLFTFLRHLLPHILSMVFLAVYALFPAGRQSLEPFGGYIGYLRGNLYWRLVDTLVASYTWRWSWLWALLGAGIYVLQHSIQPGSRSLSLWFRGLVVGLTLWSLVTYPIWSDPFWGVLNALFVIGGIVLLWRFLPVITRKLEEAGS